ncbi:MAG: MgtC/SapB family protein [Desulfuromonadales bacterium]|nr:MgtC/SapB family protein [Desulfuromonadales bacterium]NIS41776.1 MgtC/SapB family protein [Desulfuromonadales bacterium]
MDWTAQTPAFFDWTVMFRLVLAATLGALVGLEREIHGRPAGFRTHLLVAVGACLMMIVSEFFYFKYGGMSAEASVRLDPARVAAQIVTGIGFLGAGAIIKEGHAVRGLTTAACLWIVAGIGMAVGVGLYMPALLVTAISLFNLLLLKRLERFVKKDRYRRLTVVGDDIDSCRPKVESFLRQRDVGVVDFALEHDPDSGHLQYDFFLTHCGDKSIGSMMEDLSQLEGVKTLRFR